MAVYADIIFFVNFVSTMSLLLLYIVIFTCKKRWIRTIIASSISGIYAVIEIAFLLPYILRTLTLLLIIVITFGRVSVLYNTARFFFVTVCMQAVFMALMMIMGNDAYIANGSVTVFSGDILGFIIYGLSFPLIVLFKKMVKMRMKIRKCQITINGKKIDVSLLYDSGNLLMHKGVNVAVVSWDAIKDALGTDTYEEFVLIAEDRMIFNTVGSNGILPVTEPEKFLLDGREVSVKLALINKKFNTYDGIIGI